MCCVGRFIYFSIYNKGAGEGTTSIKRRSNSQKETTTAVLLSINCHSEAIAGGGNVRQGEEAGGRHGGTLSGAIEIYYLFCGRAALECDCSLFYLYFCFVELFIMVVVLCSAMVFVVAFTTSRSLFMFRTSMLGTSVCWNTHHESVSSTLCSATRYYVPRHRTDLQHCATVLYCDLRWVLSASSIISAECRPSIG